ncbi:hypothetical protein MBLNU457_4811t1 [Dothideomycetes sp. NU457]
MDITNLEELRLFRRQVLQLLPLPHISWPSPFSLRQAPCQDWIYDNLFDAEKNISLPSERYQLSILKPLLAKIEDSITNPEEDEISDALMGHLAELMFTPLPSEADAAQQKGWVTYIPLLTPPPSDTPTPPSPVDPVTEPTLKLKESRSVISGAGTTGLRTWEAALHLASYLCTTPAARTQYITNKHILELGAGTGFLSILCAQHLGATHVTSTDGDEGVIDALKENLFHNSAEDSVTAGVMRWGWGIKDSLAEYEAESWGGLDTVIGADVTYDKTVIPALASTIRGLFERWPRIEVLISATVRNQNTFAAFETACGRNRFLVDEVEFPVTPMAEQRCLFHAADVPIRILRIRAPDVIRDPFAV